MRIISLSTKITYLVDLGLNDHLIPVVFRVPRVDVFHWDETEDSEETDEDCRLQTTTNLSVTLSLSLGHSNTGLSGLRAPTITQTLHNSYSPG